VWKSRRCNLNPLPHLDEDGALRALQAVELAGDEDADKALAATAWVSAWVSGWSKVLFAYAEKGPQVQELLDGLLGDRRARREAGPHGVPHLHRP
jgi:hypothetical protein